MKVLLVKLSSLGDVVHVMPALQDMRRAVPGVQIDWAVEKSFAPLVRRCEGVGRVVECELRQWRKSPLSAQTRRQWRAFKAELQAERYDAVIDLQGLTKSALVAWLARLAPKGKRYALANQTEGSSYEAPTRWVADVAVQVEPHTHVVQRSRALCARALGYEMPAALAWGLNLHAFPTQPRVIALVHGTSRSDKLWPVTHWIELGGRLIRDGFRLALPHGNAHEQARSEHLARALGGAATVWPRLSLDAMAEQLAHTSGVIGVDSGLSHIAVALDLPHVQIYNFDTAWRTGPLGSARQVPVYAQPEPDVGAVYDAWTKALAA
ncbi:MAG: lipopolysaccharide heptosyltransferase I [Burkholderiaceae bacterium]|nr:lipopolysaccharide heptosyltransferase I [Burkholderiaceae bacterium]